MHVAAGFLLEERSNIAAVALRVGYRNEAAFSIAFKRWAGRDPPLPSLSRESLLKKVGSSSAMALCLTVGFSQISAENRLPSVMP